MVLYALNRQIPASTAKRLRCPVTLEDVLEQTKVTGELSPRYQLTAPGEHLLRLDTRLGAITCRVTVQPAAQADAPLFLYHHGLAENPYTASWQRLVPDSKPFPAHAVAIQAPYHNNLTDPLQIGFASTEHLYQMLAGSLRIMQVVQEAFAQQGAAFTVVGGVSWGGITSLLYEGLFGATSAAIPLFASPKLSQVIWDAAELFNREIPIPREELDRLLDFTPIYDRIERQRIFPVLGKHDLFFRFENHAWLYPEEALVTLPLAHVGALWQRNSVIRKHVLQVLSWAAENPR